MRLVRLLATAALISGVASCAKKGPAPGPVSPVQSPAASSTTSDADAVLAALAELGHRLAETEDNLYQVTEELRRLETRLDERKEPARPARPDPARVYKVELGDAHARGNAKALVTIVQWSDYQCPYCKRAESTLVTLRATYGKNLRIVMKHNPLTFHNQAMPAALAAEAAGQQGKFWKMHDKLFNNSKNLTEANFIKWARQLALNTKQFKRDMRSDKIRARVQDMQAQGTTLGVRGTPAFFINGRFLSGAQPATAFEVVINEELEKAKALVARGLPKDQVYTATVADGLTKP